MSEPLSRDIVNKHYARVEVAALERADKLDRPHAVILGGQPGSGKADLQKIAIQEFSANGGAVLIDADRMRAQNPEYRAAVAKDPKTAADVTHTEAAKWSMQLTNAAIEGKRNIVIDGTMRSVDNVREISGKLREQGYTVEARIMAVSEDVSMVRSRARFEQAVETGGAGRFVNAAQHDAAYKGMVQSVGNLEKESLVDKITLYNAKIHPIYVNSRTNEQWEKQPVAEAALLVERDKPRDSKEQAQFVGQIESNVKLATARESQGKVLVGDLDVLKNTLNKEAGLLRDMNLAESKTNIASMGKDMNLIVRDGGQMKQGFKGEIVGTTEGHVLVKVSDRMGISYDKSTLVGEVSKGLNVTVDALKDGNRQVYLQGKEPNDSTTDKSKTR